MSNYTVLLYLESSSDVVLSLTAGSLQLDHPELGIIGVYTDENISLKSRPGQGVDPATAAFSPSTLSATGSGYVYFAGSFDAQGKFAGAVTRYAGSGVADLSVGGTTKALEFDSSGVAQFEFVLTVNPGNGVPEAAKNFFKQLQR